MKKMTGLTAVEIKILHYVQIHTGLYDKQSAEYRDKIKKDNAWAKVAESVKLTIKICKSRYRNARQKINKYFLERQRKSA